jgi:hypothetical protein
MTILGLNWIKAGSVGPKTKAFTMDNLVKNSLYYFRVFAENAIGQSEPLETDQSIEAKPSFSKKIVINIIFVTFLINFYFS